MSARGSSDATAPFASSHIRLSLSNRPENVTLVRQLLAGFAEAAGIDGVHLNDLTTAVTEACNNVVLHAYRGDEGLLELDARTAHASVAVAVRDRGIGISNDGVSDDDGMGLSVIKALAEQTDIVDGDDGGTEVRMLFFAADSPAAPAAALARREFELPEILPEALATTIELALAPVSLAGPVLSRLLGAIGARAHFRTDRIADARLVADALAARAGELTAGAYLVVGANAEPHRIELRAAPLIAGGASRLLDDERDGARVLRNLTDWQRVQATGDGGEGEGEGEGEEMLVLGMLDPR
jgi:serine/threonine-protein kinase RsbW